MTIFIALALCVVFGLSLAAWYVNSLFKGPNYAALPEHYPFKSEAAEQQYQEYYDERGKEWPTPSEARYVETAFGKTFVRICGQEDAPPLVLLPSGGLLLDTPGMRELQLWTAGEGIETSFADIESLAADCRFADCRHESEPGCAVRAAIDEGNLDPERLVSFKKLMKESAYLSRKLDVRTAQNTKRRWKAITKEYRRRFREKD